MACWGIMVKGLGMGYPARFRFPVREPMRIHPVPLVVPVLAVALSACSSITPIQVSLPRGQSYTGTAWTNVYTGSFSAGPCGRSFNGPLEGPEVIIAMQCGEVRGTGMGVRNGSSFVGGTVALNNGTTATISRAGPDPTYHLIPLCPRPAQLAA